MGACKSLRYFMHREGATANIVLRIVPQAIALSLKSNLTSAVHFDSAALHIAPLLGCPTYRFAHLSLS